MGDVVIYKNRYSGFYNTELDAILKRHMIKNLIVTGCITSICVESTVRDAMFRDYRCLVLRDCVAEVIGNDLPRSNHEASPALSAVSMRPDGLEAVTKNQCRRPAPSRHLRRAAPPKGQNR